MWTWDPKRVFVWRMKSPSKHKKRATRKYSATSGNLRLLGERGTGHTSLLSHWFDEWASPSGRGGGEGEAKTVSQWEDILPGRDTPTPHRLQTFQQITRQNAPLLKCTHSLVPSSLQGHSLYVLLTSSSTTHLPYDRDLGTHPVLPCFCSGCYLSQELFHSSHTIPNLLLICLQWQHTNSLIIFGANERL